MKQIVSTPNAPAAVGPYSQATIHGNTIYISGQLPINMATGELHTGSFAEQTTFCMNNIAEIVKATGSSMGNILKTTILLTDLSHFTEVNEAYSKFFPSDPPARACYQVTALPKGADVEIEAICTL